MYIKNLPIELRLIATANQLKQNKFNPYETIIDGFDWEQTPEGSDFWNNVALFKIPTVTDQIKSNYPVIFGETGISMGEGYMKLNKYRVYTESDTFEQVVSELFGIKIDPIRYVWNGTKQYIYLDKLNDRITNKFCCVDPYSVHEYLRGGEYSVILLDEIFDEPFRQISKQEATELLKKQGIIVV
jgi:hypothetical protein